MYAALSPAQVDQIRDIFLQHINREFSRGYDRDIDMKNIQEAVNLGLENARQVCFHALDVHECESCTAWTNISRVSERRMLSLRDIIPGTTLGELVNSTFALSRSSYQECRSGGCKGTACRRLLVDRLPERLVLGPGFETDEGMSAACFEQIEVSYTRTNNTDMIDSYRVCAIAHFVKPCHYTYGSRMSMAHQWKRFDGQEKGGKVWLQSEEELQKECRARKYSVGLLVLERVKG